MSDKIKSRKLWAWGVWTAFTVALFVGYFFKMEGAVDLLNATFPWYGIVTVIFIGGQAAIDAVKELKK